MMKAIIFDLGGVVFTDGTKKFIEDLSVKYGVPQIEVAGIIDGGVGTDYRVSKITRAEFWKFVREKLRLWESADVLEAEWINHYDLIEGTVKIIHELKKKYKVYFLSDNVKERVDALEKKFHFVHWFDGGIFSHDAGVRKPNPKIYEYVLEKAGLKSEEAVFIDDKESALVPAAALGIKTVLFTSPGDLESQLKSFGILF